jgi:hypothetical protein
MRAAIRREPSGILEVVGWSRLPSGWIVEGCIIGVQMDRIFRKIDVADWLMFGNPPE